MATKIIKKTLVLTEIGGTGAATASIEKGIYGLSVYITATLPSIVGKYVLVVRSKDSKELVVLGGLGRICTKLPLHSNIEDWDNIHCILIISDKGQCRPVMYGTNSSTRLWQGNLLDGLGDFMLNSCQIKVEVASSQKSHSRLSDVHVQDKMPKESGGQANSFESNYGCSQRVLLAQDNLVGSSVADIERIMGSDYNDSAIAHINYYSDNDRNRMQEIDPSHSQYADTSFVKDDKIRAHQSHHQQDSYIDDSTHQFLHNGDMSRMQQSAEELAKWQYGVPQQHYLDSASQLKSGGKDNTAELNGGYSHQVLPAAPRYFDKTLSQPLVNQGQRAREKISESLQNNWQNQSQQARLDNSFDSGKWSGYAQNGQQMDHSDGVHHSNNVRNMHNQHGAAVHNSQMPDSTLTPYWQQLHSINYGKESPPKLGVGDSLEGGGRASVVDGGYNQRMGGGGQANSSVVGYGHGQRMESGQKKGYHTSLESGGQANSAVVYDGQSKRYHASATSHSMPANAVSMDFKDIPVLSSSTSKVSMQSKFIEPASFWEQIQEQVDSLFDNHPTERALSQLLPDTKWVRVDYDSSGRYYVVGVIGLSRPQFICYGVPANYSAQPPKEFEGYCQWLPIEDNPQGKGYWIMYQDATTGQSIQL